MAVYSTDWKHVSPEIGLRPITDRSTTQTHELGKLSRGQDFGSNRNGEGEFIYLKGAANTVAGSWVLYNPDDHSTSLLAANDIGPVAVAMAPTVVGEYGWYQIKGKAVAKCLAGFADNGNVYGTATPGSVDDAIVAGDRVQGAKGASAIDAPAVGFAEFEIDRPFVNDALAD